MATADSVKAKIQGLIDKSNGITEGSDKDLTSAINSLENGYGNIPIPYGGASEGEKLYDVYFKSTNFVFVDDSQQGFDDGGLLETYDKDAYKKGEYPPAQWRKSIKANAKITQNRTLKVSGADVNGDDFRAIGYLPFFDPENKTYTLEFEYFRNFDYRHKFYFATGNFLTEDGTPMLGTPETNATTEPTHACLALELNKSGEFIDYRFYRQSAGFTNDTNLFNRKTIKFEKNSAGEFVAKMKVVIRGGEKVYDTIYQHWGLSHNAPSDTLQPRWTGYLIPLNITIYHNDTKVSEVLVYQPEDIGLVLGVGNWDKPTTNEYCGIRNVSIYKGDNPTHQAASVKLHAGNKSYTIPKGYHSGEGKVSIETATFTVPYTKNGAQYEPGGNKVFTTVAVPPIREYLKESTVTADTLKKGVIAYNATGDRIVGTMEGGTGIAEISTAAEMDSILENANASDVGKFYMYGGETTDKYENGALYRIAKTETISFDVEYIDGSDGTTATESYIADKGISWSIFAEEHEDFAGGSSSIHWRNGETIKLNGEEVSPDSDIIEGETYLAY